MCSAIEKNLCNNVKLMKTILHIIDTTGPGGAETVFIDLITHLPREKYRSIVVIRGKGWVYEELCRRGITPVLLDAKGSFNWRYLKALVSLIKSEKVDLIQSHLLGSNVYSALAGLVSRKPVVATFHGAVDVAAQERFLSIKFAAINCGAAAIVAVSKDLRDNIAKRTSLRADKIRVIYNGIDTSDFQRKKSDDIRRKFGWSDTDVIIGSLGNIRPAKAYDVLLETASLLKDNDRRYRFVIAGHYKGGLYQQLLEQKASLGLDDQVHFLGFNDDPASFLSNLDLFLLSSDSEGFSIATIQAMAAGLPVTATRSGGPEEIISAGETGCLVATRQPQEMADAIKELVSDTALSGRLAQAGQQHAIATFDIQNMVSAYETIYRESM
jgi:glycosyltransferase involved in cell wall biosynthesis